jgi:hypothetical protein
MAGYRVHLATSTALGIAYGGAAVWYLQMDWMPAALGAGVTAIGGLMPDLDSDSGVPVRALFGLASVLLPLLMLPRLLAQAQSLEMVIVFLLLTHLLIRYGLAALFKRITVHRGMFHSIPAMLIAGLIVFLLYHHPAPMVRIYMAGGAMLGFLSHLVLDELWAVDLSGVKPRLNQFAGSALKFFSPSFSATLATYALLLCLAYVAAQEFQGPRESLRRLQEQALSIGQDGPTRHP